MGWQVVNECSASRYLAVELRKRSTRDHSWLDSAGRDCWDPKRGEIGELIYGEAESGTVNLGQECSRENRF